MEILQALAAFHAEGRPIWKPMHLQPVYRSNPFVSVNVNGKDTAGRSSCIQNTGAADSGADIFKRGLCLPSDNKMTPQLQERVIQIVKKCFD